MSELTTQISAADALSVLDQNQSKYANSTALAAVTTAASYLPYIQLIGSNSKEGKRDPMKQGKFALSKGKDNLIILGDSFVAFLLGWRPKAMRYAPKALSYFNPESKAFKEVKATAETNRQSKCGFGPEFLIWLPERQEYATYFLGNATGRQESPNLINLINNKVRKCKLAAHLIETQDYSWHGPRMLPYDLDVQLPPDPAMMMEILNKFNNPPESQEVEEASETVSDR